MGAVYQHGIYVGQLRNLNVAYEGQLILASWLRCKLIKILTEYGPKLSWIDVSCAGVAYGGEWNLSKVTSLMSWF